MPSGGDERSEGKKRSIWERGYHWWDTDRARFLCKLATGKHGKLIKAAEKSTFLFNAFIINRHLKVYNRQWIISWSYPSFLLHLCGLIVLHFIIKSTSFIFHFVHFQINPLWTIFFLLFLFLYSWVSILWYANVVMGVYFHA